MLSAHPRTDRGVISSLKPTNKRTSYPTLNNRSHQTENKLLKTKFWQSSKSINKRLKIKHWSPRCALWCSCRSLNHQLVTQGAKNKSPRYQHRSSKSQKVIHISNYPVQQITRISSPPISYSEGRRQGRSLNFRRTPEGGAVRVKQTVEVLNLQGLYPESFAQPPRSGDYVE